MRFLLYRTLTVPIAAWLCAWLLAACVIQPTQPATPPAAPVEPAVEANRQLLARWLHIDPATVEVISAEQVEWSDSCLGLGLANESCAAVITPGYKLTLAVDGQEYVLHTDEGGSYYRLAAAPEPAIGETILAWSGTFDSGEAMEANIGTDGVSFGLAFAQPRIGGHFATTARQAVLDTWADQYAPFEAATDFGSIRLMGRGSAVATPAEQQMIGRWAQLVAMEAAGGESLAGLRYEGPAEMGSPDTSKCAVLQLGTPIEAGIGACDGTMTNQAMGKRTYLEWEQLRDRFAAFVYETETERLVFEGMGSEGGEAWQRAILAWARVKHAELATGKTSATASTAMSWHLGQDFSQKNVCQHLTVLDYGYAYAEEIMCEGGDVINSVGDWLTSAELTKLDTWLYQHAPLSSNQNYINGQGTQAMNEADQVTANLWAIDVRARIWATGNAVAPAGAANVCPEAQDGLAMLRDYKRGFCLLVPATHTVFDTNPSEVVVAKETLLNVTEPRLHIIVTAAEGRSAEQFADDLEAEMTGFEIQRSTTEIAGQPAIVLDNVPGQDLNRRVLIVHNDRLYDLTFTPISHAVIEEFYATIIGNFVLIEPQ